MPSSHGVGTQSPTYTLAEYGTAGGLVHLQPKPGHQFIVLLVPAGPAKQVVVTVVQGRYAYLVAIQLLSLKNFFEIPKHTIYILHRSESSRTQT